MALRWKLRRVASMSPGEIAARGRRELAHRVDDGLYRAAGGVWRRSWAPPGDDRPPKRPLLLCAKQVHSALEADPEGIASVVALADDALAGRYRYVGHPEVELARPIDYVRDPFTGRRWPDRHAKRLDYRTDATGDPKWIWELNRLQELAPLVVAWHARGDRRYLDHAVGLASDWIAASRPGRGVAWSNGYEAALRAISLAVLLDALGEDATVPAETRRSLAGSLWQHARWIRRDPSTHSSANNHLLGELAALVVVGLVADEQDALDHGLRGLAREAALQVAPDGTSAEQAFRYHLHALDQLLTAVAFLDGAAREPPAAVLAALERSGDALAAQLAGDEPEPQYGDSDEAWVLRLEGTERRTARTVASAIAARVGNPGARRVAGTLDVSARLLFGEAGADRFAATAPAPEPGSVVLPDAGLVVLRRDGRRLTLDAGPLGYLAIAAHGHADALAVTLSDGAHDLVVDPGVGSYFAQPLVRAAFRGTAAHATVAVDGVDQSQSGGPFLWTRHARSRLLHVDTEAGVALAEHDGYEALPAPLRHRRLVVQPAGGPLVVLDRLRTDGSHAVAQCWPLHPSLELESTADGLALLTRRGERALALRIEATVPLALRAERGEAAPPRGWYSTGLERVEPAWLVAADLTATDVVDVIALLWPGAHGPDDTRVELGRGAVTVALGSGGRVLRLDPDDVARPVRVVEG